MRVVDRVQSEMYDVFSPRLNGKPALFWLSARDPKVHKSIKLPVHSAYGLTKLAEYEPLVDTVIKTFIDRVVEATSCQTDGVCNMAVWMRLCMSTSLTGLVTIF